MIGFWVLSAVLTVAVLIPVLRALARPTDPGGAAATEAVYRDQLGELDRDLARGVLPAAEVEAMRREVGRRLLASTRRSAAGSRRSAPAVAWTLAACVPVAALALYLGLGSPHLPAQPLADQDPALRMAAAAAEAEIEGLARHLAATPDDVAGWVEFGRRHRAMGRYREASMAFARAVGASGGDPGITGEYAEALVDAASGTVTEQARLAFEQVLEERPGDPRAQFYLAQGRAQAGDAAGAIDRWSALIAGSPADAEWLPVVRARIDEVAAAAGLDPEVPEPAAMIAPRALSPEEIEAAAALSPEDQQAMVDGMVDRLQRRAEEAPDVVEGWLRLGEAQMVVGRPADAAAAFARAADLTGGTPPILARWGEALLAASDAETLPPAFVAVMERLHAVAPDDPRALWYLGVHAVEDDRRADARVLWERLLETLAEGSAEAETVRMALDALGTG